MVTILLLAITMNLFGCNKVVRTLIPARQYPKTEFTDADVLDCVYDYSKKYPTEVDKQDYSDGSVYYLTEYSLHSAYDRVGVSKAPLCTNEYEQARSWALLSNKHSSQKRFIMEEVESEKYFEFRMKSPGDSHILLTRIDKCSYLDRTPTAIRKSTGDPTVLDSLAVDTLGYFNARPITLKKAEELIQYTYYFRLQGKCVLSSFSERNKGKINHTIYETKLTMGDWGIHDVISLIRSVFTIDTETGLIERTREILRTIKGKYHEHPKFAPHE